jgi:hypothetical protein
MPVDPISRPSQHPRPIVFSHRSESVTRVVENPKRPLNLEVLQIPVQSRIVINGFLVGVFVVFFYFGRQGKKWAFRSGMVLYGLDGLLMLLFRAFLGVAFHAFALFMMNGGLVAISKLKELEQSSSSDDPQGEQLGLFRTK